MRLDATIVLPDPPLGESTTMTRAVLGGGGGVDGPLSCRRRAVHSTRPAQRRLELDVDEVRIDDVAHPGPDRIAPEIVRRRRHQHDGHLGAVVAVGDRRHLDGEVQGNVVADAHDGCGLGADLAHDALGVERLAVAPRLEVHRTIGAGHGPDPVDQLVALGDEGDGHRATAGS